MPRPCIRSFVEYDAECQEELLLWAKHLGEDTCVFGDISSFWRSELREVVSQLQKQPALAVSVLLPLMKERKAVTRKAFCIRHQRYCFLQAAKSHTAGSSCTAYSKQGKQEGLTDPTVIHLLAWIALRREVQEMEITLENVQDFPTELLHETLGDLYHIEHVLMDPTAYGYEAQLWAE